MHPPIRSDRTFLVKRPLKLVFDAIGDMGMGQSFTVQSSRTRRNNQQARTGEPRPTRSSRDPPRQIGSQITCGSTTGTVNRTGSSHRSRVLYQFRGQPFNVTTNKGQTIYHFKQGEKGGLRDLPLSRKPIPIGHMATATSNLGITYSLTSNPGNVLQKVGNGSQCHSCI